MKIRNLRGMNICRHGEMKEGTRNLGAARSVLEINYNHGQDEPEMSGKTRHDI